MAKKWKKQGYILYILPFNSQYINHNKIIIIAASVEISEWCNLPILDWWTRMFLPSHLIVT